MYQFKNVFLFIAVFSTLIYATNSNASQVQIAAGLFQKDNTYSSPLLLVKHPAKEWRFVETISGEASENYKGIIHSVGCNESMCAAALGPDFNHIPLVISKDKGLSWSFVDIPELISQGFFVGSLSSIHCTQQACMAVGTYGTTLTNGKKLPLILRNDRDGKWMWIQNISKLPKKFEIGLLTIACNQNFCVAAGNAQDGSWKDLPPSLFISKDDGLSWTYAKNISGWSNDLGSFSLSSAHCTSKSCILSGTHRNEKNHSLLIVSDEKGEAWSVVQNFSNKPSDLDESDLYSVSCTENTCVAAGDYRKLGALDYLPLVLTSHDDGKSWSFIDHLLASERGGELDAVSCSKGICVAVGSYTVADTSLRYLPLLLLSTDQGNSWTQQNIIGLPAKTSSFLNVVCAESICNVGGVYVDNEDLFTPLLVSSEDNGKSWSVVKNIAGLPKGGFKSSNIFALTNSNRA